MAPQRSRQRARSDQITAAETTLSAAERREAARLIARDIRAKLRDDWELSWEGNAKTVVIDGSCSESDSPDEDVIRQGEGPEETTEDLSTMLSNCVEGPPQADHVRFRNERRWRERNLSRSSVSLLLPPSPYAGRPSAKDRARQIRYERRRMIDEEMVYNPGLRYWTAQRDAWTGARLRIVRRIPPDDFQPRPVERAPTFEELRKRIEEHAQHVRENSDPDKYWFVDDASWIAQMVPASSATPMTFGEEPYEMIDYREEVPVGISIFSSSNPLRAQIIPKYYPQIYSKCVIKGMTPAVPINLADMVRAIVVGWKADGQWPATDPQIDQAAIVDEAAAAEARKTKLQAIAIRRGQFREIVNPESLKCPTHAMVFDIKWTKQSLLEEDKRHENTLAQLQTMWANKRLGKQPQGQLEGPRSLVLRTQQQSLPRSLSSAETVISSATPSRLSTYSLKRADELPRHSDSIRSGRRRRRANSTSSSSPSSPDCQRHPAPAHRLPTALDLEHGEGSSRDARIASPSGDKRKPMVIRSVRAVKGVLGGLRGRSRGYDSSVTNPQPPSSLSGGGSDVGDRKRDSGNSVGPRGGESTGGRRQGSKIRASPLEEKDSEQGGRDSDGEGDGEKEVRGDGEIASLPGDAGGRMQVS